MISQTPPKVRQKHDYTSELELKSLLIRLQNWNRLKTEEGSSFENLSKIVKINNKKINRYIKLFIKLKIKEDDSTKEYNTRVTQLRSKLKDTIVKMSEDTPIDKRSYESFGQIIVLMIKSILTKHSFSGYSYKDDFYSDSIHKILKYLHNFNHKMISERSGVEVNAFAYISQIIHNSIIFIIKQKQKEQENIKDVISLEITYGEYELRTNRNNKECNLPVFEEKEKFNIKLESLEGTSLVEIIKQIHKDVDADDKLKKLKFVIEYPHNYRISFDEYNEISAHLKGNIDIIRGH